MHRFLEFAEVASPDIRRLHAYWLDKCRGREFPAKADIEPSEITSLLPYLLIAEFFRDPLRVRYRLVGTEIVAFNEFEFTGNWLHEVGWDADTKTLLLDRYATLTERRVPLFGRGDYEPAPGKARRLYEWGKFPLGGGGAELKYCLAIEDFLVDRRPTERGAVDLTGAAGGI